MKKRSLWLRTGVAFALMLTLGATPGGRVGPAVPPMAPASPSLPTPAQGVPASSPTAPHAGSTAPWLLVSDVHFNPFDDAALVDALDRAPVMHWRGIFERGGAATSTFFTDTNYALLRSALKAMQTKAPAPPVVAVAGDFLAHEFPAQYARAEPGRTQADYERFVDKTIAFLASQFDAAFPSAQFVITLGNNDGYCGDYRSTPSSPFLQHMADAWQPLVDRGGAAPDFRRDFPAAGYYTATLPAAGTARAQAVVLNSVVWSAKYGNACGDTGSDPGSAELDWLARTLQPSPGAYRWLVGHIPPSFDQYSSLRADRPVPFMQPAYAARLTDVASAAGAHVATFLLGHVHHATFQIVGRPDASGVPALIVPSISPVQGSNPAFVTADVDETTGVIRDTTTFVLPLEVPNASWSKAYSFDAAYGRTAFDAPNLSALQTALGDSAALREVFAANYNSLSTVAAIAPTTWRWYWCADVYVRPADYAACVAAAAASGVAR